MAGDHGADPWVIAYAAGDAGTLALQVPARRRGTVARLPPGDRRCGERAAGIRSDPARWLGRRYRLALKSGRPTRAAHCCSPLVTDEFAFAVGVVRHLELNDAKQETANRSGRKISTAFFLLPNSGLAATSTCSTRTAKVWMSPRRGRMHRVAENNLGEKCVTSPAFQDRRLFIRGGEHLFCVGGEEVRE